MFDLFYLSTSLRNSSIVFDPNIGGPLQIGCHPPIQNVSALLTRKLFVVAVTRTV